MDKTEENTADRNSEENPSVIKRIVRVELLSTIFVVILLLTCYIYFFIDEHLEWSVESFGSRAVGAQVDVDQLETSWGSIRVDLEGLRITNPENPRRNIIDMENFHLELSAGALSRFKFIVNSAGINGLKFNTQRARAGWVSEKGGDLEWLYTFSRRLLRSKLEESTQSNVFGDILDLLSGASIEGKIEQYRDQLKTPDRIVSIRSDIEDFKETWNKNIKDLPTRDDIEELKQRVQKLTGKGSDDPLGRLEQLKELNKIQTQVKSWSEQLQTALNRFRDDVQTLKDKTTNLRESLRSDVKFLRSKIAIPEFSLDNPSQTLFKAFIEQRAGSLNGILQRAKPYLSGARRRLQNRMGNGGDEIGGVNHSFTTRESLPDYWIKQFEFSGSGDVPFKYDLKFGITDVNTNPAAVGKPMVLDFNIELAEQAIGQFIGRFQLEDPQTQPKIVYNFIADKITVDNWKLLNSPELGLSLVGGSGRFRINGEHATLINTNLQLNLDNPVIDIKSENKNIKDLLENTLKGMSSLELSANGKGTLPEMSWDIHSNLGSRFRQGLEQYLTSRINKVENKLVGNYRDNINDRVDSVTGELAQGLDSLSGTINSRLNAMNSVRSILEKKLDEGLGSDNNLNKLENLFNR